MGWMAPADGAGLCSMSNPSGERLLFCVREVCHSSAPSDVSESGANFRRLRRPSNAAMSLSNSFSERGIGRAVHTGQQKAS